MLFYSKAASLGRPEKPFSLKGYFMESTKDLASSRTPLVSVITVSFNAARFIEQTIASVLAQTYPGLEYLIIDGGSKDGTVEIIRRYADRLAYWHSKPDRGLAHAFNQGLAQAHGEWILYLNADDFFSGNDVVEKMVPHLVKHRDADVVFGSTIIMAPQKDTYPLPYRKIYGSPWSWREFRWFDTIPHPSAFTNRKYFERAGTFNESFRIAVDYEFFLRAKERLRAEFIDLKISSMRDGGDSRKNIIRTWREGRRAQLLTEALPPRLAWLNFFWQLGRYWLGQIAHRIIYCIPTIPWPGRNPGKAL